GRHDAMLHVEEQPVEPGDRHRLGNLDAAAQADADAERQLALFELVAGNVADGGHRRLPEVSTLRYRVPFRGQYGKQSPNTVIPAKAGTHFSTARKLRGGS